MSSLAPQEPEVSLATACNNCTTYTKRAEAPAKQLQPLDLLYWEQKGDLLAGCVSGLQLVSPEWRATVEEGLGQPVLSFPFLE